MFYRIFFSPQEKRGAIITYKHGTYKMPHELSNDLRLQSEWGKIRTRTAPNTDTLYVTPFPQTTSTHQDFLHAYSPSPPMTPIEH